MILLIRTFISRWRFSRLTSRFDREIKAARKAHRAVRPIQQAKREFVHSALRGRAA